MEVYYKHPILFSGIEVSKLTLKFRTRAVRVQFGNYDSRDPEIDMKCLFQLRASETKDLAKDYSRNAY